MKNSTIGHVPPPSRHREIGQRRGLSMLEAEVEAEFRGSDDWKERDCAV
jgi:hypothetical protein